MEDRTYRISWKYKILALIAMIFLGSAIIYTIVTVKLSELIETTFILTVIIEGIAIISAVYFFTYKITVTDNDFISVRRMWMQRKIYYKDIVSIQASGLGNHIKKIRDNKTVIRIAIGDSINKPIELAMEIEIIRRKYAMIPL